jgi:hypothetical protein
MNTYRLQHKAVHTKVVEAKLILTYHATDAGIAVFKYIFAFDTKTVHTREVATKQRLTEYATDTGTTGYQYIPSARCARRCP